MELFPITRYRLAHGDYWLLRRSPDVDWSTFIVEGKPGEGKSLFLTSRVLTAQRQGIRCATNYTVRDRVTGIEPVRVRNWIDCLQFAVECVEADEYGLIALEEIQAWTNSRDFKDAPDWFWVLILERRHLKVAIIGDTQDLSMVEKRVRITVDSLLRVRKLGTRRKPLPVLTVGRLEPSDRTEDTSYDELGSASFAWIRWYVYGSYDTAETVRHMAWRELNEDATQKARVRDLERRIEAALQPHLPMPLGEWISQKRAQIEEAVLVDGS